MMKLRLNLGRGRSLFNRGSGITASEDIPAVKSRGLRNQGPRVILGIQLWSAPLTRGAGGVSGHAALSLPIHASGTSSVPSLSPPGQRGLVGSRGRQSLWPQGREREEKEGKGRPLPAPLGPGIPSLHPLPQHQCCSWG